MFKDYIKTMVLLSLQEDIGKEDITTHALVPKTTAATAVIIAKAPGIICGVEFARQAFLTLDKSMRIQPEVRDGARVKAGQVILRLTGQARALLTAERVALNFLSMLSGIATKTRAFVEAVKPYRTSILDTRKTTPLLREAERYAVRCGGGANHRFNLSAMAMIKDNHRVFAVGEAGLTGLVKGVRSYTRRQVELEVDTLHQFTHALSAGADVILLDNMTPSQVKRAVTLRNRVRSKVLLEASGGITLKNVRRYAAAGVERISLGTLTHTRQALDVSLEFITKAT